MIDTQRKFIQIKQFLTRNADSIQKEATQQHITYLGKGSLRIEFINKNEAIHIQIVRKIAQYLEEKKSKSATNVLKQFGETIGRESVQNGLTIEEAVDGTIFLKQAIWENLQRQHLLRNITTWEFYQMNQIIGTYSDVLASQIAFTYYNERQYIEKNLLFLSKASKILSSSLDYQTTLNTIASLAVPEIGDWCVIDMLDIKGELSQVAVAHKNPKKVKWAKALRKANPPNMSDPYGVANIIRTGKSELYPIITDEMLIATSKTKKDLALARSIGFTSAMTVPLFAQNKAVGAITFVTAETNRHYNEADLIMAEELGTRASVAIENASLYKGSQEAIAIRDDFISVASHELKTPVTSVKMFTQVLRHHSEQIGDYKAVDHLSKMDKQLNKLTELIYNLLNISKIQAGRMEFNYERFNFDKSVKEVVEVLQQSAPKHILTVQGATKKDIMGDEERIGQVINNLVSNAVKYSPKANKIVISLSSNKDNVKVTVQDFGIGMEKGHFKRIFERFYRVYDTTDKTFPGLGIGLYISSEIIKRHGGKFWVDSTIGKGSVFYFTLPVNGKKITKKI